MECGGSLRMNCSNLTQGGSVSEARIAEAFFLTLIMACVLFGNLLVCLAFLTNEKMRSITNYYLVSLACADILVGIFSVPFWIYVRVMEEKAPSDDITMSTEYKVYITYDVMCGTASIINLVIISIERWLSVCRPVLHHNLKQYKIFISIAVAWIYAIIAACILLAGVQWYAAFITVASFGLPLVAIVLAYIQIFRTAKKHSQLSSQSKGKLIKREVKLAVTLAIVIATFLVAWLPFFILSLMGAYCDQACNDLPYEIIVPLVKIFHYMNSMVNPIIYTYRNRSFRQAFQRLLHCKQHRRPSRYLTSRVSKTRDDS